ncbi:Structural maintenance of chromosomes protein, partial [Thalictrum thalictroides]
MGDSRVSSQRLGTLPPLPLAGIVTKIRVENFMCHSNLQIELGECVNFITGQNGSGKSAILTALCVAFGCRAKGTQRASTLKDFIKTGCSHAIVQVEIKNQGQDAFKPEVYGDVIIIERRISESTSSTVLKDHQGRKVASRREELQELVEHFNIDVENPCVIMSQDKSREFLHSGNDKEKFKFFYKATLLQQVSDLLQRITAHLNDANAQVDELESSIRPILKELTELQDKIKSMEQVEEISQNLQQLKQKLAWSWVYDVDKQIQAQAAKIEKLKERIPACQLKIDGQQGRVEELKGHLTKKKAQISSMMERTSEVRKQKDELQQNLSMATKERLELVEEYNCKKNQIQKMVKRIQLLEKQIAEIQEQHLKDTQAEEFQMEEVLKVLQEEVNTAFLCLTKLKEEENGLLEQLSIASKTVENIVAEIEEAEKKYQEISSQIRKLRQHQSNEVTAFGGEKVLYLLKEIESNYRRFTMPPIGPIGSHVKLKSDTWGAAAEAALGKLLNAFIVTNHRDSLLLRACARAARYNYLQIIIYDFDRPKLNIPDHMLPQTQHPTTQSQIFTDNPTVSNVLVDMAHAERQVLVKDYEVGKSVAFDQRIPNLKEVFTSEGHKMYSRNSVETILPPARWARTGRLTRSFDGQIKKFEYDASQIQELARQGRGRKRDAEETLQDLRARYNSAKKRRECAEKNLISKQHELRDVKNSQSAEAKSSPESNVDELCQEISKLQDEIREKESLSEKYKAIATEAEARAKDLKFSFENLCESTKHDIDAFEEAERELMMIEDAFAEAEKGKFHYEQVMQNKVLPDIEKAEVEYQELQVNRQ